MDSGCGCNGGCREKRVRDEWDESELDSVEVKRLRDDLLNLDDSDLGTSCPDLNSFMKSFEEEISVSPAPPANVVDLTSDAGDSQPELGYLLEASDDELGLPSSTVLSSEVENNKETESVRVLSDSTGLGELWGFEDEIPSYDWFGLGIVGGDNYINNGEYVGLNGLFIHSDQLFGSSEYPDGSWWSETLPAQ
ncbi:uncharacterized protein LOC132270536 [Cornus florida]|uniref:uncharacterized protein LOC132270536 n=1 Tax=Cornus florida TaxID=4283 RepID=UPI00289D363F|nr:uncharacterized protein LOC132270536 [Cornus florida]